MVKIDYQNCGVTVNQRDLNDHESWGATHVEKRRKFWQTCMKELRMWRRTWFRWEPK